MGTNKNFLNGLVLAMVVALLTTIVAAAPTTNANGDVEQLAVVFAPWMSSEETYLRVAAAGARPVRNGALGSIVVAAVKDRHSIEALHHQGAWLVMDSMVLGGCADPSLQIIENRSASATSPNRG